MIKDKLVENEIKGADLCFLEEKHLKEWGINKLRHRSILLHNLQLLLPMDSNKNDLEFGENGNENDNENGNENNDMKSGFNMFSMEETEGKPEPQHTMLSQFNSIQN